MKTLSTPFDGSFAILALFSVTVGYIIFDLFIALIVAVIACLLQCYVAKKQFMFEGLKEKWIKENKVDYLDEYTFTKAVQLALNNNWELKFDSLTLASPILPSDADDEDELNLKFDLEELLKTKEIDINNFKSLNDICKELELDRTRK